jgi:hippurate hydrolase
MASGAPKEPEFTPLDSYPVTENEITATAKLSASFDAQFGDGSFETVPATASEEFSIFDRSWQVPDVFWFVGGTDSVIYRTAKQHNKINTIPSNRSPKFYPVIHPTLTTGLQATISAAATWLNKPE